MRKNYLDRKASLPSWKSSSKKYVDKLRFLQIENKRPKYASAEKAWNVGH